MSTIARPFGMLLMFLYTLVNNYGVAILFFALIVKLILLPFQMKSKRGMMQQARLQPKIAEIQKKHGTNKAKINEETMKLYKEEGVNPASGCIWGLLPFPIMLALYYAIRQPITIMMGVAADLLEEGGALLNKLIAEGYEGAKGAYEQIAQSQFISNHWNRFNGLFENLRNINFNFLGLDFGITPQWNYLWSPNSGEYSSWFAGFVIFLIPLISGGMQFLASTLNKKLNPQTIAAEGQAKSMNTMMMLMPLISVYIAFVTPAALGFYWTVSTVFQIIQDVWLTKVYTKKIEAEEAVKNEARRIKEAEIEAKRIETERKKAEGIVEKNPNVSKRKKQMSEKQEQIEKAAEWEKKNAPIDEEESDDEPSRAGARRFARGRAYDPDRYAGEDEENSEFGIRNSELSDEDDDSELPDEYDEDNEYDEDANDSDAEDTDNTGEVEDEDNTNEEDMSSAITDDEPSDSGSASGRSD